MLAIIYLDVCDLTVGNLIIGEKDPIWIISVWIGNETTRIAISREQNFQSKVGKQIYVEIHKTKNQPYADWKTKNLSEMASLADFNQIGTAHNWLAITNCTTTDHPVGNGTNRLEITG